MAATFAEMLRGVLTVPKPVADYSIAEFQAQGGARAELARIQKIARDAFEKCGRMDLTFAIYHTIPAPIVSLCTMVAPPPGGDYSVHDKTVVSHFIRFITKESEAICVATLSETWNIRSANIADVRAYQARNKGSIEGHPAAREVLLVGFECARFSAFSSAEIREEADPIAGGTRRVLGAWEVQDKHRGGGRFVNILKPIELAEN